MSTAIIVKSVDSKAVTAAIISFTMSVIDKLAGKYGFDKEEAAEFININSISAFTEPPYRTPTNARHGPRQSFVYKQLKSLAFNLNSERSPVIKKVCGSVTAVWGPLYPWIR